MKRLSLLVIVLILTGCNRQEVTDRQEKVHRVTVTEVKMQEISQPIRASGKLSSREETKLSFKTGGVIEKIRVAEGEAVRKGTLLASLNLTEINARTEQADQAFRKAERDYKRVENLYHDSVATLENLQDAGTALEVARTNVDIARFNLKYSTIEAPANGKILLKLAEESEIVSAGQPVFLFGSSEGDWVVRVSLTDRDIILVNLGDPALVYFDAYPGKAISATVSETGKSADPYTGTYEVELTIKPVLLELASGFVAQAEILPPQSDSCLMVPVDALVEAEGNSGYLFVARDSVAEKRKVTIRRVEGMVCVTSGLDKGERVVMEGAPYLSDGDKIQLVKPVK
ncbi:MAG: efflux RND transporter periplasmic adaptor subunit [Bacteroidetes bacterium]|nr:MAG: efflux RND transporter periplasmic adaptor subunit [Bacteroidota bacterium]